MNTNIGILLAAGRGTRLQPFTDTTPKPLVNFEGKTLLEWNMDEMHDLVDYYIVVVNWLKEKIISKIGNEYRQKRVIYVIQENPKGGTLDAFRVGISKIDTDFTGLIVANSDDIRGKEYYAEIAQNIIKNNLEPVIAAKFEMDETKLNQFGIIKVDQHGKYLEMIEKPQHFVSNLINIGLYYFPKKVLEILPAKPQNITHEEYLIDLFNDWVKFGTVAVVSPKNGFYKTVTRVEDLPEGN